MCSTQSFPLRKIHFTLLALVGAFSVSFVNAQGIPDNVDGGLRNLISSGATAQSVHANATQPTLGIANKAIFDSQGRVLCTIHLNGAQTLANVHTSATTLGGNVTAESSKYRSGIMSAYMPISAISQMATKQGVLSVHMALRPITHSSPTGVGIAISGGALAIHSQTVNASGFKGAGIMVGLMSNSFDTAYLNGPPIIRASDDVASGDLPGVGNPDGYLTPVNVLADDSNTADGLTDEGRAMCQIVHDVAPGAALAFATANPDVVTFANNILALQAAGCNVIADDVLYFEEPMFSDGIIAQAVDTVAASGVMYFSSAGNEQGAGYVATFTPISDATARAGIVGQNLKLNQVPAKLTKGGFHNFSTTAGSVDISQTFTADAGGFPLFVFQWNDPYDSMTHPVTTDYNILIFDAAGNYISSFSGIDKNTGAMGTGEPLEEAIFDNTSSSVSTKYQIAITRADTSPATPKATQLRYFCFDLAFGQADGANEYYQPTAPATYGHSSSANAMAVAAYVYDSNPSNPVAPPFTPVFEDYTSQGPSTIYFDSTGAKLSSAQVRPKPDIAAPDGGNTTFFGFDYEGDGLPNFFGTSAAAPHAAGVAALMLNKAASHSETLTQAQVRSFLQKSPTSPHDLDPFSCTATATATSGGKVIVTGVGNDLTASADDPNFFTVTFVPGKSGETLQSVTIDLTHSGLKFDSTVATGLPFTLGHLTNITANKITNNVPLNNSSFEAFTVTFANGAFTGSSSASFGVDRDWLNPSLIDLFFSGGNHADFLSGAQISAVTSKGTAQGTFMNKLGTGFSILDGWGLIDAVKAVQQVP